MSAVLDCIIEGTSPSGIAAEAIERGVPTRLDHAAYLRREAHARRSEPEEWRAIRPGLGPRSQLNHATPDAWRVRGWATTKCASKAGRPPYAWSDALSLADSRGEGLPTGSGYCPTLCTLGTLHDSRRGRA